MVYDTTNPNSTTGLRVRKLRVERLGYVRECILGADDDYSRGCWCTEHPDYDTNKEKFFLFVRILELHDDIYEDP